MSRLALYRGFNPQAMAGIQGVKLEAFRKMRIIYFISFVPKSRILVWNGKLHYDDYKNNLGYHNRESLSPK